jgi:O-antigen/teichoic acid export membrane protein
VTYLAAIVLAANLDRLVHLEPAQVRTGQIVLLVTSVNVALGTAFSVFGAITNGFQRYDLNNMAGAVCSLLVALANVTFLAAGFGLVGIVVATTAVRMLAYVVYRRNAYRVFPGLKLRPQYVSSVRFREVTSFSVYVLAMDWAKKLNYSIDALVIGVFLNTSAVAVWSIGQRLAEATQRLTSQLSDVLFPVVVDHDTSSRADRLQAVFLVGTRLSLASVTPIVGALLLMAGPFVHAWVGPAFSESVAIVQVLAITVALRVGSGTASTVLKGAGRHRLVAGANLAAAAANVTLSVVLIGYLGLLGVALGTLVPVGVVCVCVIFPAGCRRVGITVAQGFVEAVWPALWPVAPMGAYVLATRSLVGASLPAIVANMAAGALVYAVAFFAFGLTSAERRFCVSKLGEATARARMLLPTTSEGA